MKEKEKKEKWYRDGVEMKLQRTRRGVIRHVHTHTSWDRGQSGGEQAGAGGWGRGKWANRHGAPDLQTPLHSPRENMLLETGDAFVDHQLCAGAPRVRLVPSSVPKSWVARGPGRRRSPEKGPRAQRLKAVSRGRKRKLPNRWEEGLGRKGACLPSRRKAHAWGQRLEEQNAW